jgi:DNA polymerase-3 subunit alpha
MYVPLKVTTDYSLLKSTIKIDSLISFLLENNINACAICDEYLYGVMEFYNKCLKNNIKPIIGLEIKISNKNIYLYAMNYQGYQNMLKLNTIKSSRDLNFVDLEINSHNILAIVPYDAIELYDNVKNIFSNTFIGYFNEYEKTNALIVSNDIVYINDICSLKKEDTIYIDYLNMIKNEEKISTYEFKNYEKNYFKTDVLKSDEQTTIKVADMLNVTIPKDKRYIPKYNKKVENSYEYLDYLTKKGLKKRLNGNINSEYNKRLEYELSVIKKMGFVDYILIVYDYVLFAKKNNIFVGAGRGSAAGSLVCYTLGITDIDPLKYNLLFERFLNPERVTMPDIDIDFENTKRGEVVSYIKKRYGIDKVASIITFQTLKSKLALRDVARIFDYPLEEELLKNIGANLSLKENLQNEKIKNILKQNKKLQEIYKIALKIEGFKKNISTHAAGVVISSVCLDDIIPVIKNNDGIITGITMEYLEELGLLKMDLLAIKNLTIIANILELIKEDTGKAISLSNINLEDKDVLELFKQGNTTGIFQFESNGMKQFLKKLKPDKFSDLVVSIALYRPGPMDNIDSFIRRRNKTEKVDYIIPELEKVLKETEGIIVYQEQVMQILSIVGNFSFAQADIVRRAMSKKKKEVMEEYKKQFISGAIKNGYQDKALEIYNLIYKFANYGFNKSHSVSYSLIGYQMAYLKVKFPKYFITNMLNMSISSETKLDSYIQEAKKYNLIIVKPNINLSKETFYITDNKLIMAFSSIKGLSSNIISSIIKERTDNGNFIDFIDFVKRMYNNINKKVLEILINASVFSDFGNISTLKENLDVVFNYAEIASSVEDLLIPRPVLKPSEISYDENKLELDSYGFYINNHPTSKYFHEGLIKLANIKNYFDKYISCVVLIESIKYTKTKDMKKMAFIDASCEDGIYSFVVFPNQIGLLDNLKLKDICEIQGKVTKRFDKYQINVSNIIKK